jgi:histidine triad (HIT) family protein
VNVLDLELLLYWLQMQYDGNDIYCDLIIPGEIDIKIVKETDNVLAYHHTKPHWPVHIVVTPKKHVASILEMSDESNELAQEIFSVLTEVAKQVKDNEGACRIVTNLGDYQDSKHLHFHVASGKPLA